MLEKIGAFAQLVADQFKAGEKKVVFTAKCKANMEQEGFTQEDAFDVFYKGAEVRKGTMKREYYNRTLVLFYFRNNRTGDYVVTWFGKENQRRK